MYNMFNFKMFLNLFYSFLFSSLEIVSKMIYNLNARVYQIIFSNVSICNTFVVQNSADRVPNFKMAGFGKTRTSSKVQYRLFLGIIGDFDDVSVVLWFKRYSFSSTWRSFCGIFRVLWWIQPELCPQLTVCHAEMFTFGGGVAWISVSICPRLHISVERLVWPSRCTDGPSTW